MKKKILLIIFAIMLVTTGCTSELRSFILEELLAPEKFELELSEAEIVQKQKMQSESIYPYFNSLTEDEQEIYLRICTAIEDHDDSQIMLRSYNSQEECKAAEKRLEDIYQSLVFEQAQYFWVNIAKFEHVTWTRGEEYIIGIKLSFILEEEDASVKKKAFQSRVDTIVQEARNQAGTFEQVLSVYNSIIKNTTYSHELADNQITDDLARSAYGCLVDQKTVCSGYAMAFNLIMQKLGYECGVEFNAYDVANTEDAHVWNYAKLDEDYYYFDLTWDDTIFEGEEYRPYMEYAHQYFAITKAELPHALSQTSTTPECNGRKYNYFVYNNFNLETYDFALAKEIILRQSQKKCVELRFDNASELQKAETDLLTNGRILDIFPNMRQVHYSIGESNLHLYIFLD